MKVLRETVWLILMVLFLTSAVAFAQSPAKESYDRGVEYAIQGEFEKAKKEFESALKAHKSFVPAKQSLKIIMDAIEQKIKRETAIHLFEGLSYANKGLYDQAIKDYTKAIEIDPGLADAYYNRGIAYDKKGQYDQAIKDYSSAIEIAPGHAFAYNNRGVSYANKGLYDQAIKDYTRAIEINPGYAWAYANRGFTYLKNLGDKTRGCDDMKKACELGECGNYNFTKQKGDCP